jgi:hypothetical protein
MKKHMMEQELDLNKEPLDIEKQLKENELHLMEKE